MNELRKAIFLDRDGVINKERSDYVKTVEELTLLDDIENSIKKLRDNGFLIVVITNQSAINRGLTNRKNVEKIHSAIQKYLKRKGTKIDAFYYCPHRPDEYCDCRKPKPGLSKNAEKDLKIDLHSSWMIGDRDSNMEAATLVGCKSIKIAGDLGLRNAVQSILNSN